MAHENILKNFLHLHGVVFIKFFFGNEKLEKINFYLRISSPEKRCYINLQIQRLLSAIMNSKLDLYT